MRNIINSMRGQLVMAMLAKGVERHGNRLRAVWKRDGILYREDLGEDSPENRTAAIRKMQIIFLEMEAGTFDLARHFPKSIHVGDSTFSFYLDRVLEIKQADLAPSSFRPWKNKAEHNVRPRWGEMQIEAIEHIDVMQWLKKDLAHYSNKTLREFLSILNSVFRLYSTRNKSHFNPCHGIRLVSRDDPDPDPFARDEIRAIFSTPSRRDNEMAMFRFMLFDGCRISELIALGWDDIDMATGEVSYSRSCVAGQYRATKTRRSTRTHFALAPASKALEEQFRRTGNLPSREIEVLGRDNKTRVKVRFRPVFINTRTGEPYLSESNVSTRSWTSHLEAAGVRYRSIKNCRHTFISQMLTTGVVPLQWIANHVGHENINMIQKRYAKWINKDGEQVYRVINDLFAEFQ